MVAFSARERQQLRARLHLLFDGCPEKPPILTDGQQAEAYRLYLLCRRVPGAHGRQEALFAPSWRPCPSPWCSHTTRRDCLQCNGSAQYSDGTESGLRAPLAGTSSTPTQGETQAEQAVFAFICPNADAALSVSGLGPLALIVPPRRGGNIAVPLRFMGVQVQAIYDTGSPFTYVDELCFPPCAIPGFREGVAPHQQAVGVTGHGVETAGSFRPRIRSNKACGTLNVLVSRHPGIPVLLGLDALWPLRASFAAGQRGFEMRTGRPLQRLEDPITLEPLSGANRSVAWDGHQRDTHLGEALQGTSGIPLRYGGCKALVAPLSRFTQPLAEQLRTLFFHHDKIWNAGERPLAATQLLEFKVELKPHGRPLQCNPRPLSPVKRQKLDEHLSQLVEQVIIKKEWSRWTSPLVLVPKSTDEVRICTDLRRTNALTQVHKYPILCIDHALDAL